MNRIAITIAAIAAATNVAAAQTAPATPKTECTTDTSCAAMEACKAKPYHKWLAAHAAGDVNAKTGKVYKRNSNGQCRIDTKAVKAAIDAGKIK